MEDQLNVELRCLSVGSFRSTKRCESILTIGRWPRKLESAKECVTTHQSNALALKMDGAQTHRLYSTVSEHSSLTCRETCCSRQSVRVNVRREDNSADLE